MKNNESNRILPFTKENYKLIGIGFAIIVLGYLLMIGGAPEDPKIFNPDVFSFRRVVLAPLVILFGVGFEIYAIIKKPKDN
jgi:NhaP-type Na+/H+ or K+/H+ antiporter